MGRAHLRSQNSMTRRFGKNKRTRPVNKLVHNTSIRYSTDESEMTSSRALPANGEAAAATAAVAVTSDR